MRTLVETALIAGVIVFAGALVRGSIFLFELGYNIF